jgi:hypothetical protein
VTADGRTLLVDLAARIRAASFTRGVRLEALLPSGSGSDRFCLSPFGWKGQAADKPFSDSRKDSLSLANGQHSPRKLLAASTCGGYRRTCLPSFEPLDASLAFRTGQEYRVSLCRYRAERLPTMRLVRLTASGNRGFRAFGEPKFAHASAFVRAP